MATVQGSILNAIGKRLPNVALTFFNKETGEPIIRMSQAEGKYEAELAPGNYVYVATEDGYLPETAELNIPENAGDLDGPMIVFEENQEQGSPPVGSPVDEPQSVVDEFLDRLDDVEFSIDVPISVDEAKQAIGLFAVANIMLAGSSQYTRNGTERADMLGVLTMFYGLADKSLSQLLAVDSSKIWDSIEAVLQELAEKVDQLQLDVDFLSAEAKRQFNLGISNSVLGNTEFPSLFRRYVEVGADPLLAVDLKSIDNNPFFDAKKPEVYDLLRDLKDIILKIVRSLSVYGTIGTSRVNKDWAEFEKKALEVLLTVARERTSEDRDELTVWNTLAVITQKPRDTIVPYVALARSGTNLLEHALAIYERTQDKLDVYENSHLQDLFQPDGDEEKWFTTLIRTDAAIVERYPLSNWG